MADYINPQQFGAVANGQSDDTSALVQSASIALQTKSKTIHLTGSGYKITGPVDLSGLNIMGDGKIVPATDNAEVWIGNGNIRGQLTVSRLVRSWNNTVGIRVRHCRGSNLSLSSSGSSIGILFDDGPDQYTAYNTITLQYLTNNNIGIQMSPSGNGFVNENLFLSGEFGGLGLTPECAIKMVGIGNVDHNVFMKPCFEQQAGWGIICDGATNNQFISARWEAANNNVIKFLNDSQKNLIELQGIDLSKGNPSALYDGTSCNNNEIKLVGDKLRATNQANYIQLYDDGSFVHAPGFSFFGRTVNIGQVFSQIGRNQFASIDSSGVFNLYGGYGLGNRVYFKEGRKQLYIDTIFSGWGLYVRCWKADNTIIGGTAPYYVMGRNPRYDATNQVYQFDHESMGMLLFHSDVDHADVMISNGNASSPCGYLRIYAPAKAVAL